MGRQLEAGQEVLFDIADAVFDPALGIGRELHPMRHMQNKNFE
jgi:hypothetical protein